MLPDGAAVITESCLLTVITSEMLDVLETTTVLAKYPENGRINKPTVTRPPPKPRFPIAVDGLEEYITSRKANDFEELRREYMVRSVCFLFQFFKSRLKAHVRYLTWLMVSDSK